MLRRANRQMMEWALIGFLWILVFFLGWEGFSRHAAQHQLNTDLWDHLYLTFQLISFNSGLVSPPIPFELNIARFFMPFLTGAAAIKVFWGFFNEQIQMIRILNWHGHVIICGLSRKGYLLATRFRQRGDKVVVIELNEDNNWLQSCKGQHIPVIIGNAAQESVLRRAGVKHARGVIVVCDEDEVNAEIAVLLDHILEKKVENMSCLVHINDPQLCVLLKELERFPKDQRFRIDIFNIYEQGASLLLNTYPIWDQKFVQNPPQILLIGLGLMGEAVIVHAARDWWARRKKGTDQKIGFKIIDQFAREKINSLLSRQPGLEQICDLEPLEMDIRSPEFEQGSFLWDEQKQLKINRIYVCFDNDSLALNAALILHRQIKKQPVRIVMRMNESNGLSRLVDNPDTELNEKKNIIAFCLLDKICVPEILSHTTRDILARASHEVFSNQGKREQTILSELYFSNTELNASWDRLSQVEKRSHYQWVDHIHALLETGGYEIIPLFDLDAASYQFTQSEIELMASKEHDLWCRDNVLDGWQHADGPKNEALKTHPDLIAWEKLTSITQQKIKRLIQSIPAFLVRSGYQVNKI